MIYGVGFIYTRVVTVALPVAASSFCWASGPSPVGSWIGRFDLKPLTLPSSATAQERRWAAGIDEWFSKARLFLTIKPDGTYSMRGENLPAYAPFAPKGTWKRKGGGYTVTEDLYSGGRPKPLDLSKDGKSLSFKFRGGQVPIRFARRP